MNRDQAVAVLRLLRPQLEARGIEHAGLFGYVARGDAGPQSDVDVVVTPREAVRFDLWDAGSVQDILERGFAGRSVDVVVTPVSKAALKVAIDLETVDAF